jgi:mono/diheme cytochrome c family protein
VAGLRQHDASPSTAAGATQNVVSQTCPSLAWIAIALALALSGCSGCASYRRCNAPPPVALAALPARLSETGLFADAGGVALGATVRAYEPAFALWSDGAQKRRWIFLPEGTTIDTSDPDDWSFPMGTKLWKEFSVAGRRIETRLLVKHGPTDRDWAGAAYVWDAEQRDATLTPAGLEDADGHRYDVPSATDCAGCHGGRRSHVLGFSAVQLAKSGLPVTLENLIDEGRLSRPPARMPAIPGDDSQQRALGYLHANCGHCHNRARPPREGARCYDPERRLDFWLPSDPAANALGMPAVTTSVPRFVTPGEPDDSRLIELMARRGRLLHMPPLASQRVDPDGVRLVRAWVQSLREKE